MSKTKASLLPVVLLLFLPQYCFGHHLLLDAQIQLRAEIVSFLNLALFITALISVKQYFWPGDNNTMPFHYFNIIFTVLFYAVSLPFLISNRQYYAEYAQLLPIEVLQKFFLSLTISSFAQWFIIASVFINVLYIKRFRRDYYQAGIASGESTRYVDTSADNDYPGHTDHGPIRKSEAHTTDLFTEHAHRDDNAVEVGNENSSTDTTESSDN